ncbi:ribonuclease H-like domain-containing protein [Pavlovales sp. CCMP2436]|nr:ribonuclease H-like domain-containing protein [Pavlovales sp. CCMP2436]
MRKGLDAPVPPFEHLVVLDFEWTADKQRRMEPCSEITQFPSVLVKLAGRATKVIDEFDTFVRPRFNPLLSRFARELTAITQADVDGAPSLEEVIPRYLAWLHSHGLAALDGAKIGHWAFCTWSDADVGTQLATETRTKGIPLPQCFQNWVDLKPCYRSHFRTEPRGGLQACVERLGLAWEGRAHNGLVDSQNTSKIVLHMAQGSYMHGAFVFKRPTRGLDAATGIPFGSAKRKRT